MEVETKGEHAGDGRPIVRLGRRDAGGGTRRQVRRRYLTASLSLIDDLNGYALPRRFATRTFLVASHASRVSQPGDGTVPSRCNARVARATPRSPFPSMTRAWSGIDSVPIRDAHVPSGCSYTHVAILVHTRKAGGRRDRVFVSLAR